MKYLIAVDSDGTLRTSDGIITERTKSIIKDLVSKGYIVAICTARPRYYTKKIATEAGASEILISSNGAEIYDDKKESVILALYISTKQCEDIYKYAKEQDLRVVFVTEDIEYATKFIRNDNQILLDDSNIGSLLNKDIKQIMVIGKEKSKIMEFRDIVASKFDLKILDSSSSNRDEIWFSIGNESASKGNAMLKLTEYLNIPIENTIAIGNDYNDLSMFKECNISVAVANSNEDIKKSAKIITDSNDNDGVAKFLEKLIK